MNVGVNLYGLRGLLYRDFDGTLKRLKAGGITSVEPVFLVGGAPLFEEAVAAQVPKQYLDEMEGAIWPEGMVNERVRRVRELGLEISGAHLNFGTQQDPEKLKTLIPQIREIGRRNRIGVFVISMMIDKAGMERQADFLNCLSAGLKEDGIQTAYHNHEVELLPHDDHAIAYLVRNCPDVMLETDVGWVFLAGLDPAAFLREYREKILLLHVKDVKEEARTWDPVFNHMPRWDEEKQCWNTCNKAVGEGSIPLKKILEASEACLLPEHGLIIDQDDAAYSILDDILQGVKNLNAVKKEEEKA